MNIFPCAAAGLLLAKQVTAYALHTDVTTNTENISEDNQASTFTFPVRLNLNNNFQDQMYPVPLSCFIDSEKNVSALWFAGSHQ